MNKRMLHVIVGLLELLTQCSVSCLSYESRDELYKKLLQGYNKMLRPVDDHLTSLHVSIKFSLDSVNHIDEVRGTMSFTSFITVVWRDERINWNITEYPILFMIISHDEVWKPNLVVMNPGDKIQKLNEEFTPVRYVYDGMAVWQPPVIMQTSCAINIKYYPFDIQNCKIRMTSWMDIREEVSFSAPSSTVDLSYFQTNGEWDIKSTKVETFLVVDHKSIVEINIELKRKPLFLVMNIILPVIFLGVINPLVFILPVDSGERVSYAITVLLSLAVFMTIVSDRMPDSSEPSAVLSVYLLLMLVYSAVIMITTIVSHRFYYKDKDTKVPGWMNSMIRFLSCSCRKSVSVKPEKAEKQNVTNSTVGKENVIKSNDVLKTVSLQEKTADQNDSVYKFSREDGDRNRCYSWRDVAETLDFLFFVVFLATLLLSSAGFLLNLSSRGEFAQIFS